MKTTLGFIFVLLVVIPFELTAQAVIRGQHPRARSRSAETLRKIFNIEQQGLDLGITLGTSHTLTDIGGTGVNARMLFLDAQPRATGVQLGGFVRYHINDMVALRAAFNYASVGAADSLSPPNSGRFPRGYHFRNNLFEVALEGELYIPKAFLDIRPDVYLYSGFLILFHKPQLNNATGSIPLSAIASPQPVIPFGIGMHYTTRQNIRFGFRLGLRKTFFDTLDGHAPVQGPNNDFYFFNSFSVGYFFEPRRIF